MTDTNQASEDDKAIMIGFLYGIQSDFLPADEVRHRMAGFRHTQGYKDAIELIRTEKLKLLDKIVGIASNKQFKDYTKQDIASFFSRLGELERELEAEL